MNNIPSSASKSIRESQNTNQTNEVKPTSTSNQEQVSDLAKEFKDELKNVKNPKQEQSQTTEQEHTKQTFDPIKQPLTKHITEQEQAKQTLEPTKQPQTAQNQDKMELEVNKSTTNQQALVDESKKPKSDITDQVKEFKQDLKEKEQQIDQNVELGNLKQPEIQTSNVEATQEVQQAEPLDQTQRTEIIEKLQVSARQLQISSDKTSMQVTLQNSVLENTSFVLTTAQNGDIAVTFSTTSNKSQEFLQRNADTMMAEVSRELGVQVKMVVRQSEDQHQNQHGQQHHDDDNDSNQT